ncbi:phosphatidylinositol-3-phosphatase SAC1-like isoform X2 [Gordionus sp. m RMFG-2023]|uniref:phosphatidylinositol-3-phosphatase SAC1-like isoform X2 n=1 Tax=Gordionus sp. m RMFG-2023 TaxID=3053472 RepID=UPI0031FC1BF9
MPSHNVYQEYILYITNKEFFIDPLENDSELLIIDRISNEINVKPGTKHLPPSCERSLKIFGILGTIQLLAGNYLIVITSRVYMGQLNGHMVWKANTFEVQDNKIYVSMLNHVLALGYYYYSTSHDLSHNAQFLHQHSSVPDFQNKCLFDRSELRFVWNLYLMLDFANKPQLNRYKLPVIRGFVSLTETTVAFSVHSVKCNITFGLISRRSAHRAGVRFYTRGLDEEGHPANFIETEQIVTAKLPPISDGNEDPVSHLIENIASYIQTRGSVPVFWSQTPNLKYKPQTVISESHDQLSGFTKHMSRQISHYGKQVIINLLDDTGSEGDLSKAFRKAVEDGSSQLIKYFQFDFHRECAHMQYHRLDKLMESIDEEQDAIGYFAHIPSKNILKLQNGVFRTNCADCLDRTNVVQSLLGRRVLDKQLKLLGIIGENSDITQHTDLNTLFQNEWTENANICSWQYAGSGALKTDFTRTGERTKLGLARDGLNSAIRYYKNNFVDGFSQDATHLLLGNFVVDNSNEFPYISPFKTTDKDWKYLGLPVIFIVSFTMVIFTFLLPSANYADQMIYYSFWIMICMLSLFFIYSNGLIYVDRPRLNIPKVKNE